MKLVTLRKFFVIGSLALLVVIGASYEAQAKGRGRGDSKRDKKCAKFVNCHDASEGRVDGRGPRRDTDDDNWNWRRFRNRRDGDRYDDHQRRRRPRRDWRSDRNGDWRDRDRDTDRRTWTRRSR